MQRLFDIKKTQLEMMFDRGYNIRNELQLIYNQPLPTTLTDQDAIDNLSLTQFITYIERRSQEFQVSIRNVVSRIYELRSNPTSRILVLYTKKNKDKTVISTSIIRAYITNFTSQKINHGILIVNGLLSPKAKTTLTDFVTQNRVKSELFSEEDLGYNPTRHVDVPIHKRLTPEESQIKLQEMRTNISKLPLIRISDPIVRYYGWSIGDIIQIHRDDSIVSVLVPKSINYRVVID